nr:reverse transcriptase domain-containing protein [Tanacetum cinerariifolium]
MVLRIVNKKDRLENKECFRGIRESYDNSHSSYGTGINHRYRYPDRDRSHHMKRGKDSESPLSSVSKSDSNSFTPRIRNFKSLRKTQIPNNVKTYDGTGNLEDHIKIFQAAGEEERWAMPTWCHMFNSTLIGDARDGETIEDFMEWFKVETGRMKGAPECMRIFGFMHGVNNLELTKPLNEHVSKTMEEMMITTTAFIQGEAVTTSKKKGHASWRTQDQSKRKNSKKRSTSKISQWKEGILASLPLLQGHQKKFSRPRLKSSSRRHLW